jgi:hypothetical protein
LGGEEGWGGDGKVRKGEEKGEEETGDGDQEVL